MSYQGLNPWKSDESTHIEGCAFFGDLSGCKWWRLSDHGISTPQMPDLSRII